MNEELQVWSDSLTVDQMRKEIKALRLILKIHGEIVEMNAELKRDLEQWKDQANFYEQERDSLIGENETLSWKLEQLEYFKMCADEFNKQCEYFQKENARLREVLKESTELLEHSKVILESEGYDMFISIHNFLVKIRKERGE